MSHCYPLEHEFRRQLNQPRDRRADDVSKMRVIHFAVNRRGPVELGMVEHLTNAKERYVRASPNGSFDRQRIACEV